MTIEEIWATLGIAETQDRGAVRRAYAQRLKLVHPEDDPEGFKTLREAYELALAFAEGRLVRAPEPGEGGEAEPEEVVQPEPAEAMAEPPPPAEGDPVAAHFAACNALIDKVAADAPDDELRADLTAILHAPILENLSIYERTGLGLARALLQAAPKGACLVERVVIHFGWLDLQDRWDSPPEIAQLRGYRQMLADRQSLRESHSRAYALLTSPPPRRRDKQFADNANHVARLLGVARRTEEWLCEEFDPASLKWWEERVSWDSRRSSSDTIARRYFFTVLILFALVIGCAILVSILGDGTSSVGPEVASLESAAGINQSPESQAASDGCARDAASVGLVDSQNCDAAVAFRPGSTAVRIGRAYLNLKLDRPAKAEADFSWIIDKMPQNAFALFGRGLARAKMGASGAAHADLCRASQIVPSIQHQVEEAYRLQADVRLAPCPNF